MLQNQLYRIVIVEIERIESWENMARKKKNEEVTIVATKNDSDTVTDLEVKINEKVIGRIQQGENDRQFQVTMANNHKATTVSVEDAVQTILADYNLHN